jgi:hypothetical protein
MVFLFWLKPPLEHPLRWLADQLPTFAQRRPILYFSLFAIFVYSRAAALRQLVRSHQLSPCCAVATVIA